MFCSKCGKQISSDAKFCNNCGNPVNVNSVNQELTPIQNLGNNQQFVNSQVQNINVQPSFNYVQPNDYDNKLERKKIIFLGLGIGIFIVFLLFIVSLSINKSKDNYYFDTNSYENDEGITQTSNSTSVKKGKYATAIIYDNIYSGVKIKNDSDAYELIEKDSVDQKDKCPPEIKTIENDIIKKYGITAVNLCEMDVDFAKEIGNVIKKIYDEYPSARGYITNLSLANVPISEGYIAAFMPIFNFATSNSNSTYPWVIKTQILLNTSYFLNTKRLNSSVKDGSNSGHFPPNATIYSPIAHELGHYLSFLAMMKKYEMNSILLIDGNNVNTLYELYSDFGKGDFSLEMITEAFQNYKKDTNTKMSMDEWRGTISNYALAKDNSGNYIYDETIAESFHDVYLNGDNAKDASKYIVKVLKNRLER